MIEQLKGKSVLLFGEPASGKSYALCKIARKLLDTTGKKALLIWSDTNLMSDWGNELRKLSGAEVYIVNNVYSLLQYKLPNILSSDESYSFVAIDSISGLEEMLVMNEKIGSPRRNLLLSQLCRAITFWASKIAQRFNIPVFTVAHSTPIFDETWRGLHERPAFTRRGIKNTDVIIQHRLKDSMIVWKIVMWRSLDYDKIVGKEYTLDELLK